jgi:hypothetical protein
VEEAMTADDLAKGVADAFYTERRHWVIRGSKTNPGIAVVARIEDVDAAHGPAVEHYQGEDCATTYDKLVGAACGAAALRFLASQGIESVKAALDAFVAAEADRQAACVFDVSGQNVAIE